MAKLKEKDFKHFKTEIEDDISFHDTELKTRNRPEEVIQAYQGMFFDDTVDVEDRDSMIENYLFISANTVLPSLFFQMPRINIRSKRTELDFQAAVLNSAINVDFDDRDKEENQLCIIDAFLPYGYAVMKNGYNSRTGFIKREGKPNVFTGKTENVNENDMEGDVEFIQYEKAIGVRQSPKITYLDKTQPFGKGNRITFEYVRTLQQLIDSNLYNLSSNFINYFSGKGVDKRLVKMTLFECWIMIGGMAHKLAYVEGWDEAIAWVKTKYDELPVSYLRFNKMGDVLYNISHGALALSAQKEVNYLNELWKKHVDNIRNQHVVDSTQLTESGKKVLRTNNIGGIVEANKPVTQGIAAPLQSASMDPNLFGNLQTQRDYLKLILSTTGGKAGGADSKLATVEKNKAMGDALRNSGMRDSIRDFLVSQVKQRIKNLLRLASPEMILQLTGESLVNPMTGKPINAGDEIEIGGMTGFPLQDIITGDIDTDFIFDVDITSAAKPDFPVIRKQLAEGITLAAQLDPKIQQAGKKVNYDEMLEDYFDTFDTIPDAKKYITDMSDEDKQRIMQQMAAQQMAEGGGVPEEGQIARGAESVGLPTGLGVQ